MRRYVALVLVAMLIAGCGSGGGKGRIADQVEDDAENRAAAMDEAAATMTNALKANAVEQQADIVRSAGKERADAIRNSQLDASQLTGTQKNALIAGNSVGTPNAPRR